MGFLSTPLMVSVKDRDVLEGWLRSPSTSQRLAIRAKIVLASAAGESVRAIGEKLDTSQMSVCRWRDRFRETGIAGLKTKGRSGRPSRLTDADEARVLAMTMVPPLGKTHWSSRALGKRLGLSHTEVHRIWRTHGLQPHRVE